MSNAHFQVSGQFFQLAIVISVALSAFHLFSSMFVIDVENVCMCVFRQSDHLYHRHHRFQDWFLQHHHRHRTIEIEIVI